MSRDAQEIVIALASAWGLWMLTIATWVCQ
jgi:hypothetical protein